LRNLEITRGAVLGTVVIVLVALLCFRFGFWQLDRRSQRADRNRTIAERLALPAQPLTAGTADSAGLLYRRVIVEGEADVDRSVVWAARTYRSTPGVHVLTPYRQAGRGAAVLVDMGWAPSADARSVDPVLFRRATPRVVGLVLPLPDEPPTALREPAPEQRVVLRLARRPIEGMLPYALAPFYVRVLAGGGTAGAGPPHPLPPPELDAGPHLGYAVQWFSFGAIALIGWVVLLATRGGRRLAPPGSGNASRAAGQVRPPAPPG
jgi:surfeit locus 1 family protein